MGKRMILAAVVGAVALVAIAADELTISAGWTWSKGGATRYLAPAATRFDVAGDSIVQNIQALTTNAAALSLGSIGAPGWGYFKNLDATNDCEVGVMDATGTNFVAFLQLGPAEHAMGFLVTNAPYARAVSTTNSVSIEYAISER